VTTRTPPQLALADRLALTAMGLAVLMACAGLIVPGLYRDRAILVEATRADNLFQLLVALLFAIAYPGRERPVARVVVVGVELYLAYFFGLYALAGVVGWATLVEIGIAGLAAWGLILGLPAVNAHAVAMELEGAVWRRTTVVFLVLVAGFHIPLWAGQIVGSAASGELPPALVAFGWVNTPVYMFDLAFAMPLGLAAAALLARHDRRGPLLAVSFAWFSGLLALDMVVEQLWIAAGGGAGDPSQVAPFGVIALLSAVVIAPSLVRRTASCAARVPA
jgi:hypothetical protein